MKRIIAAAAGTAALVTAAIAVGNSRWHNQTEKLRSTMRGNRRRKTPERYDEKELVGLPAPVQRYFHAVLRDGQPVIEAMHAVQSGQFNASETTARWVPFTATQYVETVRPAFDWDACMFMAPGVKVLVRDAYVGGRGLLRAKALGLVPVADSEGTPELARGELMRWLAEAAWYPTALLPSQGVEWEPLDDSSARATLTDGPTTVTLDFHFGEDELISIIRAAARDRTIGKTTVPMPWQGRFWSYKNCSGVKVPTLAEVSWLTPEGPMPYWRGRVTGMMFECTGDDEPLL